MNAIELSTLVTNHIKPFLSHFLEAKTPECEEGNEAALKKATVLWEKLLPRLSDTANEAFEDAVNFPEDKDAEAAMRLQIRKIFILDESFSEKISDVLEEKAAKVVQISFAKPQDIKLLPRSVYQLPEDIENFTGREDQARNIVKALKKGTRYINISSTNTKSGVGKRSLAVHAACIASEYYQDAQIFLDMHGDSKQSVTPAEAMTHIIHAFRPKVSLNPEQLTQSYQDILIGHKLLIVLDNVADAAHVRSLLPPYPSALIVTSYHSIKVREMQVFDISPISKEESVELLQNFLDSSSFTRGEISSLASLCQYLPLVLYSAGMFLKNHHNWPIKKYIKEIKENTRAGVNSVVWFNARHLLEEKAEIVLRWYLLLVFPESMESNAAGEVWKINKKEAICTLDKLVEHGLLIYCKKSRRYRLHELMRTAAQNIFYEKVEMAAKYTEKASKNHAVYYGNVAQVASEFYVKGSDDEISGLNLFDTEWVNIRTGHSWAEAHVMDDDIAAQLCNTYAGGNELLSIRQNPNEQVRWLETALTASRILKEQKLEMIHLNNLGDIYKNLGEARRSIEFYDKALTIARELNDRKSECEILLNVGISYAATAEYSMAKGCYDKALSIAIATGDRKNEGMALENMGLVYVAIEEHNKAIEMYEKALAISRETNNRQGEENTLGNLGLAYAAVDKFKVAIKYYNETLAISRETGNLRNEGSTLGNLGFSYNAIGESKHAVELYRQSLEIARKIGSSRGEANTLCHLGDAYKESSDFVEAVKFYKEALAGYRKTSSFRGEAGVLTNMGDLYTEMDKFRYALEFYEQGLTIYRNMGSRRGESNVLWKMGLLLDKQGNRNQAIAYVKAALSIHEQVGNTDYSIIAQKLSEWQRDKGWMRWLGITPRVDNREKGV